MKMFREKDLRSIKELLNGRFYARDMRYPFSSVKSTNNRLVVHVQKCYRKMEILEQKYELSAKVCCQQE